jgi:hypothetical protein
MPNAIENLQIRIADQIKTSWERCDATGETMATLAHLVHEGRETIIRSKAQLARGNERNSFVPARPLA